MAGVWTQREDEILREGNARKLRKLDEKHGYNASTERSQFLQLWRTTAAQIRREKVHVDL